MTHPPGRLPSLRRERPASALRAARRGAPTLVGAPGFLLLVVALALAGTGAPAGLAAQEPPDTLPPTPADTLAAPADTVAVPADSLAAPADSAGAPADSLGAQVPDSLAGQVPDSLAAPPDSLAAPPVIDMDTMPVPVMPGMARGPALDWTNQVWEWDRAELHATRALDLTELLSLIPGAIPLRGGDYGMPRNASAFAVGPGRIRVFLDGFEMLPVEGGVADLTRIGTPGLERVRVERTGADLRVELWSLEQSDPRPYTMLEIGTGDLETNMFRGTFGHPRVLGGKAYVALDRLDTQGTERAEPGTAVGGWLMYSFEPSDRFGIRAEFRRLNSERDTLYLPSKVTRTDWVIRARGQLGSALRLEGFAGRSWATDAEPDTLVPFTEAERTQYGARVGLQDEHYWAVASGRIQTGDGVPGSVVEVRGGASSPRVGGAAATLTREGWDGASASDFQVRAWTRAFMGFSLFGSYEDGKRGVPFIVPPPLPQEDDSTGAEVPEPQVPEPRFTERTATRIGAQFNWRGIHLSGAAVSLEVDSLHPLGLPTDAGGLVLPGGKRDGYEVAGTLPLWPRGLRARGAYQWWKDGDAWRYLPERSWKGELDFQRTFLQSGNLEFLITLGVQGRDPMVVPNEAEDSTEEAPLADTVPWEQAWYARLQIRIMTFRIFVNATNFTDMRENQDYPGRRLPGVRVMTGVRWTLWN